MKAAITIVMLVIFCVPAYSLEGAVPAQDKTAAAQEDNLLSIYKQGWQVFVAPSVWVPGANKERLLGRKKLYYNLLHILKRYAAAASAKIPSRTRGYISKGALRDRQFSNLKQKERQCR